MLVRHFILATAGHVDHGKSALVKTLTGTDPDRLPEEKARGITIELGFAQLVLPDPAAPDKAVFDLGVVDVPGHEDFVKNMVAGVGTIDVALVIVAADDGWMPQTEEHAQILDYLGVAEAVVALTKIDRCLDPSSAKEAVRRQLSGTPFATAPIVPTSVVTGEGLDELRLALAQVLSRVPPRANSGKPRLPVDRAFSLPGIGTIVTGTMTGGAFNRQQAVIIQPTGATARIRALQRHGRDIDSAGPGMRVALSIPEIPLATADPRGVARGQVVTIEALGAPTQTLDVELRRIDRAVGERAKTAAARPLKDGTRVRLHHGSANAAGRLQLSAPLNPGERAIARIRLEDPLFVSAGDRFILRDWPEQMTLAGGLILDLNPPAGSFNGESQSRFLSQRARQPDSAAAWIESLLQRDHHQLRARLLANSRFEDTVVNAAIVHLAAAGSLLEIGPHLVWADWWRGLRDVVIRHVQQEHREHPERLGLALTALHAALMPHLNAPELFEPIVAGLCRDLLHRDPTSVRLRTHRPALPPALQAAGNQIRTRLSATPFEPPARKDLAPDAVSQQALRFLIETTEVVNVSPDLVMLATALAQARDRVRQHIVRHGPTTAGDLRQALGTNRRVIIPLLELLDRDRFTVRDGDRRRLREENGGK